MSCMSFFMFLLKTKEIYCYYLLRFWRAFFFAFQWRCVYFVVLQFQVKMYDSTFNNELTGNDFSQYLH